MLLYHISLGTLYVDTIVASLSKLLVTLLINIMCRCHYCGNYFAAAIIVAIILRLRLLW